MIECSTNIGHWKKPNGSRFGSGAGVGTLIDMKIKLAISLIAAFLCANNPAFAQKSAASTIDSKAQDLLKQSAATYQGLHSLSCHIQTELILGGVPGSRIIKITLACRKPDQAAVTVNKKDENDHDEMRQYFSDGKNFYLYAPDKKEYTQDKLPANIPAAAPALTQGQSFVGLLLLKPSGLLALADPARTKRLTLGPIETLNGAEVRTITRVVSGKDGGTMTFYITLGTKDHLLHRFADTIKSPKPLPMGDGSVKQIDNRETYTDIQIDPILSASTFLPPPDAKQAEPDTYK